MSVAYDSEIFVRQQRGGVSRYFAELVGEFVRNPGLDVQPTLLFQRCSNSHLQQASPSLTAVMPPLRPVPRGIPRMLHLGDRFKDAFVNYRAGTTRGAADFDWLHATYFRPRHADIARGQRLAVTLYDMIPELLGVDMAHGAHRGKHATLQRADLILSISQSSADQLAAVLPTTASKTVVVPLGVSDVFLQVSPKAARMVDFPYVMFVGSRLPYKRFDLLLAAMSSIRDKGLDVGLVAIGEPLSPEEHRQIVEHLPHDRFVQITPDDQALAQLYAHAEAFVFPSQMEGFGLPLLEAMASGCPVVASDIAVFLEVAGSAAQYFESGNADSLAQALGNVLTDTQRRAQLQTLGRAHAAGMTWQATAAATAAAYRACEDQ